MKYEAALFDLDGTLLDTGEGVLGAVRQVVEAHGCPPLDEAVLRTFVGPPIQKSFAQAFGLNEIEAKCWAAQFRDLYSTQNLFKATLYDDIVEVFEQLQNRGIGLAVATYKREDYAVELLRHFSFDRYTRDMFGSDEAGRLTKADIIALAAQSLGAPLERTLMVGDTVYDALGAYQAGIPFLGVTYGYGFKKGEGCDYPCIDMVDHPIRILEYF